MLTTKLIRLNKQDLDSQRSLIHVLRVLYGKSGEMDWMMKAFGTEDPLVAFWFSSEDEFQYGALLNFSKKDPSDFEPQVMMVDAKVKGLTKEMRQRWLDEGKKTFLVEIKENEIIWYNEEDSGIGKTTDPTLMTQGDEESQVFTRNPNLGEVLEGSDLDRVTAALESFSTGPRRYKSDSNLHTIGETGVGTGSDAGVSRGPAGTDRGGHMVPTEAGGSRGPVGTDRGEHMVSAGTGGLFQTHASATKGPTHESIMGRIMDHIRDREMAEPVGAGQGGEMETVVAGAPGVTEDPILFNRDVSMPTIVNPNPDPQFAGYRSRDATFNVSEEDEPQYHLEEHLDHRGDQVEANQEQATVGLTPKGKTQFFSMMGTPYQASTPYPGVALAPPKLVPAPRTSTLKSATKSVVGFQDQAGGFRGHPSRLEGQSLPQAQPRLQQPVLGKRGQGRLQREDFSNQAGGAVNHGRQETVTNSHLKWPKATESSKYGGGNVNLGQQVPVGNKLLERSQAAPKPAQRTWIKHQEEPVNPPVKTFYAGYHNDNEERRQPVLNSHGLYEDQGQRYGRPENSFHAGTLGQRPLQSHFLPDQGQRSMFYGQGRCQPTVQVEEPAVTDEREAFSRRSMTQPYGQEQYGMQSQGGSVPQRPSQGMNQAVYQQHQTSNISGAADYGGPRYRRPVVRISTMLPSEDADAEETIEALRDIQMLGYNEMEVIAAYLGSSDSFRDLRMGLSNDQKTSLARFAEVLRERKPVDPDIAQARFDNIKQKYGEDEMDLWFRCVRLFNMSNDRPPNMAVGRMGQHAIRGRFISALRSDDISDKLRLDKVPYEQLVARARELRLLSKHLRKSKEDKVMAVVKPAAANQDIPDVPAEGQRCKKHPTLNHLDKDCTRFKLCSICNRPGHDEPSCWFCSKCGYHHMQLDCRANAKTKAKFNKRRGTWRGGAQRVDGVQIEENDAYKKSIKSLMAQMGSDSDSDDYLPDDYPFQDTRPEEFFGNSHIWEPEQE